MNVPFEDIICPDPSQIACGTRLSDGQICRGICPKNQICIQSDSGLQCQDQPSIFTQAWFYVLVIGFLLAFIIILTIILVDPSDQY